MDTEQKNRPQGSPPPERRGSRTGKSRPRPEQQKPSRQPRQDPAGQPRQKRQPERRNTDRQPERRNTAQQPERQPERQGAVATRPSPQTGARAADAARKPAPQTRRRPPEAGKGKGAPAKGRSADSRRTMTRKQARQQEKQMDLSGTKRAYGKSKPKKKSVFDRIQQTISGTVRRIRSRNNARNEAQGKPRKAKQPIPTIIYTEPKAFNRTRLLVQLVTVGAIVAAMVMGMSVFFKVDKITITGANVYSPWRVREASGITEGTGLLTFNQIRASAQIKAQLPYVNKVRFGIKLPDTVNIIIEEEDVTYAIKDSVGNSWLMNSSGRIIEPVSGSRTTTYTQIEGLTLENPAPRSQAVATELIPISTDPTAPSAAPITVTGAQRLEAVLRILRSLEENDIVGEAASIDVSRLDDIILWYGTRYQVNFGDTTNLEYKVNCMNDVILQLSEYESGILDVSFTIWPDQVIYTPFT